MLAAPALCVIEVVGANARRRRPGLSAAPVHVCNVGVVGLFSPRRGAAARVLPVALLEARGYLLSVLQSLFSFRFRVAKRVGSVLYSSASRLSGWLVTSAKFLLQRLAEKGRPQVWRGWRSRRFGSREPERQLPRERRISCGRCDRAGAGVGGLGVGVLTWLERTIGARRPQFFFQYRPLPRADPSQKDPSFTCRWFVSR